MVHTFTTISLPETVNHCANDPRKTMRLLTTTSYLLIFLDFSSGDGYYDPAMGWLREENTMKNLISKTILLRSLLSSQRSR